MSTKYNNLGAFFRDLPEECPKLAPLLLYVNRPSISSFFKSNKNLTFMIPSESMMSELKHDFESKNFKSLDLKILSLLIPESLHSASDWRDVSLSIGQTTVPVKSLANRAVIFENGAKATLSNKYKSQNISFWELNGDQIPLGSIHRGKKAEPIKKKRGGFENPGSTIEDEEKQNILGELRQGNFKQLVCDFYNALDTNNQKIADCLINGNPAAEFFYLFDSQMISYDVSKFNAKQVDNCEKVYEELCHKEGSYLCNNGDSATIEKLKEFFGDTHFYDNEYKEFYKQVEEKGTYNFNGKEISVCPPEMGKYLYSIEAFGLVIRMLEEKITDENKSAIIDQMIIFNAGTNTRSTENLIFSETDNLIENLDEFKRRFAKCGFSFCKKEVRKTEGAGVKGKSRKLMKHKKAFSGMSKEQKQKLIKYLNNESN